MALAVFGNVRATAPTDACASAVANNAGASPRGWRPAMIAPVNPTPTSHMKEKGVGRPESQCRKQHGRKNKKAERAYSRLRTELVSEYGVAQV
jgi:hypothetical protein